MQTRIEREVDRARQAYEARDNELAAAESWSAFNPRMLCLLQQRERALVRALTASGKTSLADSQILEVGCGDGNVLSVLHRLGARAAALHGVELSESRVVRANTEHPAFSVICGSASELPYDENSFDITCQFMLLSSVLDSETRAMIASEMCRVTRPGGLIISYDIRPIRMPLRILRAAKSPASVLRRLSRRGAAGSRKGRSEASARDSAKSIDRISPISAAEVAALLPSATWTVLHANIAMDVGSYASTWKAVASDVLSSIPGMCTHELAVGVIAESRQL